MKRSIAMKWAKALESGRYKQGKRALRTRTDNGKLSYCCLGVLCNITKTTKWKHNNDSPHGSLYGEAGILPTEIAKKVGMNTASPVLMSETGVVSTLVTLNDKMGYTFKQIAKLVREQWKSL